MCTRVSKCKTKAIKFFRWQNSISKESTLKRKRAMLRETSERYHCRSHAFMPSQYPECNISPEARVHNHFINSDRSKKIVPPCEWDFNASPEITILFHSQRYWRTKFHSLGSNPAQSALRLDGTNNARVIPRCDDVSHTTAEKIDSKCIDINTPAQKSMKDSQSFLIYYVAYCEKKLFCIPNLFFSSHVCTYFHPILILRQIRL